MIGPCYVITLDKRACYVPYITEHLNKFGTPNFCFVGRGEIFPREEYFYINESNSQVENYNQTVFKILEYTPWNGILLLEDDVKFLPEYENIENYVRALPDDWDMFYLGIEPKDKLTKVNNYIYRVSKGYTLHAVLIRNTMYDKILALNPKQALDVQIAELHAAHNIYCTSQCLVTQRAGFSEYAGIEVPEKACSLEEWL